jgi:hypothetical protein
MLISTVSFLNHNANIFLLLLIARQTDSMSIKRMYKKCSITIIVHNCCRRIPVNINLNHLYGSVKFLTDCEFVYYSFDLDLIIKYLDRCGILLTSANMNSRLMLSILKNFVLIDFRIRMLEELGSDKSC